MIQGSHSWEKLCETKNKKIQTTSTEIQTSLGESQLPVLRSTTERNLIRNGLLGWVV